MPNSNTTISQPPTLPIASTQVSAPTTPSPSTSPPPSPLLHLPPELHHQILNHLTWRDHTTLRLTHSHFTLLLPTTSLRTLHQNHQHSTHHAELTHLHTTLGYSNAHWTGFSQGWGLSPSSLSDFLPCYRCLRWLPAADGDLGGSAFSRGMATGEHDLGMAKARGRICVECGVRGGFYCRGARVRNQVVCWGCGGLGERVRRPGHRDERGERGGGLLKGRELRWHYFCRGCVEGGGVPGRLVFEHWRRWGRYEAGLEAGRRGRAENGRRVRAERGIGDGLGDRGGDMVGAGALEGEAEIERGKHWCPIVKEKRLCPCWKMGHGQKPEWVVKVENSPWIW